MFLLVVFLAFHVKMCDIKQTREKITLLRSNTKSFCWTCGKTNWWKWASFIYAHLFLLKYTEHDVKVTLLGTRCEQN